MHTLTELVQLPGLWWLLLGAAIAGIVRGFTGFGTAMVYLPFASAVVSPVTALVSLISMDIFGPLPMVPSALRKGQPRDIVLMGLGLVIMLPVGLWFLVRMESDTYRYVVSVTTLICVMVLLSGLRYRGQLSKGVIAATGGLGGFLGGVAGLPGPPVTVLYMASSLPAETVRANMILYLILADLAIFPVLGMQGVLGWEPILIGLLALLPYMAGTAVGAALFDPAKENLYRAAAFVVITVSALTGLPLWG
ncbi:sulfite exporter TauE/SafE family protein [Neptunicoccus sediminis]|uniref:sulfite exporter TauE/SafE family protein n=1 Tax=Neptunicoccus sediminis TaxID=1892596 RepID=UPI000845CF85|nr:sulfite exporter TauE/SafE family protein [Neptunicoccus sediminis]